VAGMIAPARPRARLARPRNLRAAGPSRAQEAPDAERLRGAKAGSRS